jgi:hypothetical protein
MRRWCALSTVALTIFGCGDGDGDDAGEGKKAMAMDQVPALVLKAAKEAAPDLTFYAAYKECHRALENQPLMGASEPATPCG